MKRIHIDNTLVSSLTQARIITGDGLIRCPNCKGIAIKEAPAYGGTKRKCECGCEWIHGTEDRPDTLLQVPAHLAEAAGPRQGESMSADNWAICPICKEAQLQKVAEIYSAANGCYGKVSQEEFLAGLQSANAKVKELESDECTTFREDYSVGIDTEGTFGVSYSGGCQVCGSFCKYSHKEESAIKSPVTAPPKAPERKRR